MLSLYREVKDGNVIISPLLFYFHIILIKPNMFINIKSNLKVICGINEKMY